MELVKKFCGCYKGVEPLIEMFGRCLIFLILVRMMEEISLNTLTILIFTLVLFFWTMLPIAQEVNLEGEKE